MSDDPLPPPLCKICNANPHKYHCPRCGRKTCSLPCYKRHQRLYECSGKRDPTAKVSRAQLATPAALDHDYNFLTGIERAVEAADRDAEHRTNACGRAALRVPARGSPFANSLAACSVHIRRAPEGMSRQRLNDTHWMPKRKQIVWTVEWIQPDGTSTLGHCTSKSTPINAYCEHLGRHPLLSSGSKKRKLGSDRPNASLGADVGDAGADVASLAGPAKQSSSQGEPLTLPQESAGALDGSDVAPKPKPGPKLHLYLLKPFTKGNAKVLTPLHPDKSLFDCLRWREIFEFPTIQVLKESEEELPDGFILEKDYFESDQSLISEVEAGTGVAQQNQEETETSQDQVTPSKVLEHLQKDIAQLVS